MGAVAGVSVVVLHCREMISGEGYLLWKRDFGVAGGRTRTEAWGTCQETWEAEGCWGVGEAWSIHGRRGLPTQQVVSNSSISRSGGAAIDGVPALGEQDWPSEP